MLKQIQIRELSERCINVSSCDIPAARKVCGFLSHAARLGCSKCLKIFQSGEHNSHVEYTVFEDAPLRTEATHHHNAQIMMQQNTATAYQQAECMTGSRYTPLWGSCNASSRRSSFINAAWCGLNGRQVVDDVVLRPGVVVTYLT